MVFFALDRIFVTRTESSDDNRFVFTYPFLDINSHVGLGSNTKQARKIFIYKKEKSK